MVTVGDPAPDFTAPLANGEVEESFTLSENLDDAPIVLAFFPGAFSTVCMSEMNEFNARLSDFEAEGASIYGISADLPFSLNEFKAQLDLGFDLISDFNTDIASKYDADIESELLGFDITSRAVFVIDGDGEIVFSWDGDPSNEPDYEAVYDAVQSA
ncbi:redoxin domain-containing protein [Halovivax limisalsi]|uniref:redoxin domain-containing protein n=1 Tax=Halovivax limisalsi TaxID=1453760 RepID=UPI001FFD5B81|nr:redoxin domain-containing protein [Halovivax limisalsi]